MASTREGRSMEETEMEGRGGGGGGGCQKEGVKKLD